MMEFAGFDMPVQYSGGIQEEVRIVRNESGLFDLCHMGRLVLSGPDCVRAADHVLKPIDLDYLLRSLHLRLGALSKQTEH